MGAAEGEAGGEDLEDESPEGAAVVMMGWGRKEEEESSRRLLDAVHKRATRKGTRERKQEAEYRDALAAASQRQEAERGSTGDGKGRSVVAVESEERGRTGRRKQQRGHSLADWTAGFEKGKEILCEGAR